MMCRADRRLGLGKQALRKSLRSDHARLQIDDGNAGTATESAVNENMGQEEVREDTLRPSQSPVLEDVRELLGSASTIRIGTDDDDASPGDGDKTRLHMSETLYEAESTDLPDTSKPDDSTPEIGHKEEPILLEDTTYGQRERPEHPQLGPVSPIVPEHSAQATSIEKPSVHVSDAEAVVHKTTSSSQSKLKATTTSPGHAIMKKAEQPSPTQLEADEIIQEDVASNAQPDPSLLHVTTPTVASTAKSRPKQLLDALSPGGSPQIGTSLLRRESLRRKESPTKKRELRKTKSPKKRNTLSRRDTLQEREILQKVIAETNQDPSPGDADREFNGVPFPSSDDFVPTIEQDQHDEQRAKSERCADEKQPRDNIITGAEGHVLVCDHAQVETELHRAKEAIEVFEQSTKSEVMDSSIPVPYAEAEEVKALYQANEMIAKAELEEAAQKVETIQEQSEQASRMTRSGARFSDDTSMLRDFLNRAQASKAAKIPTLSPLEAAEPQTSPRRSPRKAHGPRRGKISTPQKFGGIANRPGTPPGLAKSEEHESDDAEEITATPTSCRRSTRTRLPAPSIAPPGAPSFIPVRRADGADPVVLQKSRAQELAIVTRANTRRNKGQSRPPILALKDLPTDLAEPVSGRQGAEGVKSVGWARTLARYQDPKELADEVEEGKPMVRRIRGLGAVNGTPAPKKIMGTVGKASGTPARRGKVR